VRVDAGGLERWVASLEIMEFGRWEVLRKLRRKYGFENPFWRLVLVGYCLLMLYCYWVLLFSEGIVLNGELFVYNTVREQSST
jgi:hypothetical protein